MVNARYSGCPRTFNSQMSPVQHLDFCERLKVLDFYLLECQLERYIIIHVWKILCGLVPNLDSSTPIKENFSPRQACLQATPGQQQSSGTNWHTKDDIAFLLQACPFQLAHMVSADEECSSAKEFKWVLDGFLKDVHDQPKIPHYTIQALRNSILD